MLIKTEYYLDIKIEFISYFGHRKWTGVRYPLSRIAPYVPYNGPEETIIKGLIAELRALRQYDYLLKFVDEYEDMSDFKYGVKDINIDGHQFNTVDSASRK